MNSTNLDEREQAHEQANRIGPDQHSAMVWLAQVRDDFRRMADEANKTLVAGLADLLASPSSPSCAPEAAGKARMTDERATEIHRNPTVRASLLGYINRPCDDEASAVVRAIESEVRASLTSGIAAPADEAGTREAKRWCETCEGGGTIDLRLGGESFSDPAAKCPDCDGNGWWIPSSAVPSAPVPQPAPAEAMGAAAWMDEKGGLHHSDGRRHLLGLVDETCGSADWLWSGNSIEEAGRKWRELVARGSKDVSLTCWPGGAIAHHRDMEWRFGEPSGTFACPVCGQDTPHNHSLDVVNDYRESERSLHQLNEKRWRDIEAHFAKIKKAYPPYRPLFLHPPASPAHPAGEEQQARDAARYRWLCEHKINACPSLWGSGVGIHAPLFEGMSTHTLEKSDLDSAIDSARAAMGSPK